MMQLATTAVWPSWDTEGKLYFAILDSSDQAWESLWNRQLPYSPLKKAPHAQADMDTWKSRWEARYGKLDAPETQEQERRLMAKLKQDAIDARKVRTARERIEMQRDQVQQRIHLDRLQRRNTGDLRSR